jgi:hypothetical protein
MKDFNAFKESITQEILNKWSEEVYDEIAPAFEALRESDPEKYFVAYPQSFALKISMRMLEAYHNWLHQ